MTTPYRKNFAETFPFSDQSVTIALATATPLSYTIPGTEHQTYRVKFASSSTADVWVRLNGTATAPTPGAAVLISNQEYLPKYDEARYVKGGDTLSFLCVASTALLSIALLLVQDN